MRGDPDVIDALNEHLTLELTAINQYFLNSKVLEDWGLPGLAKLFRDRSFEEMKDAEELIERILYLGGHPNLQRLDTVRVGEDPIEMIELGIEVETLAVERLQGYLELCDAKHDGGTRELFAEMIREEEGHLDYFESQRSVIERVGVQNYLARYAMPDPS